MSEKISIPKGTKDIFYQEVAAISIKNMETKEQFTINNEELDQWLKNNL